MNEGVDSRLRFLRLAARPTITCLAALRSIDTRAYLTTNPSLIQPAQSGAWPHVALSEREEAGPVGHPHVPICWRQLNWHHCVFILEGLSVASIASMVRAMSVNAVTWAQGDWALFLDVDGTLLEIAETPQSVHVPEKVKQLLVSISAHLDGAMALVSGRSLDDIDQLFEPLRPCASAMHGCELRDALGCVKRPALVRQRLDSARVTLAQFVRDHPGLLLEDKGFGLALHFRRVPHLSADVRDVMKVVRERLGSDFLLQGGKCVFELRPAGRSKGTSIAEFMQRPPFRGRTPVFLGDDLADEEGFAVVNAMNGVSVRVGEPGVTLARHRLHNVSEVIRWLEGMRDRPT
jgi:trehalose 6-phosphate phosphatase